MRGEYIGVKNEICKELFLQLEEAEDVDGSIFMDLFRDTIPKPIMPKDPVPVELNADGEIFLPGDVEADAAFKVDFAKYQDRLETYTDASSEEILAWNYFQEFYRAEDTNEAQIIKALEKAFDVFDEFGGDEMSNAFYKNVEGFMEKYSLRYDLRRPFSIHPTLPGVFARLMRDLRQVTSQDAALATSMRDFEDCVRDLKGNQSPLKVKQCIAAQFNLLEALLRQHPNTNGNTFGAMCNETGDWPHDAVKESAKQIYKFASDYPGIRHGGTPANQIREIDMRDLVSVTIMLAGFTPYFSQSLNASTIYSD